MKDLFLHYRFTDRGGKYCFDIYAQSDSKTRKEILGEIRLSPAVVGDEREPEDKPTSHGTG
jgi:hypothetical protein